MEQLGGPEPSQIAHQEAVGATRDATVEDGLAAVMGWICTERWSLTCMVAADAAAFSSRRRSSFICRTDVCNTCPITSTSPRFLRICRAAAH